MTAASKRLRFWIDGISQATCALRDHRLLTVMSILGTMIGIAAVMAVGTISKSGHYLIFNELETFGLRSVWVFRNNEEKDPHQSVRPGTGIEAADMDALRPGCCPAVSRLSPIISFPASARQLLRVGDRFSNASISGVGIDYPAINNDNLVSGQFFKAEDVARRRPVAVIGPSVAEDVFGTTTQAVGKELRIGDRKYMVVGLLEDKSRDFLASIGSAGGQDANSRILLPYTTLQMQSGNRYIQVLQAEAVDQEHADAAVAQIILVLENRHSRRYAYKSSSMAQYIATDNRILERVSLIGIVAASISLLVGGMGILNIVSTSVLERTREIGPRKAIGASRQHILFQFPSPSWSMVAIALLVSIAVGLASGFHPARRAAKLRPVIALRYEKTIVWETIRRLAGPGDGERRLGRQRRPLPSDLRRHHPGGPGQPR